MIQLHAVTTLAWVRVKRYCELSGETANTVHYRRRKKVWIDGVHTKMQDGKLWINLVEIQKWIESNIKS
jgi:hypothetical protein